MTTNVETINVIEGVWKVITAKSDLYTSSPTSYQMLWYPDTNYNIMVKQRIEIDKEKELEALFKEFAAEDIKLAEMGLGDYADILSSEDKEC
jgi:hypothetical protein